MLEREEYVEQAHLFASLAERKKAGVSTQDILGTVREEILSTTKLPLAIDFLNGELKLNGVFHTAMAKLGHYFTPFQTFVIAEAEDDRARFDLGMALEILAREARYRAAGATAQGIFLYEFESLSRNRLRYDRGLEAIAGDEVFDPSWKEWIMLARHQIGLVDFADLIYVRSQHYAKRKNTQHQDGADEAGGQSALFGEGEGRIALANRGKDPLLLFSALHRHLGYPEVPRPPKPDESPQLIPLLARRVDRLEARVKLLEEETKGGIDITKFYAIPDVGPPSENA
ncbi:MAG TPA: hypothetical protein VL175_12375 [Pirellulales bacterium]|jgi:hypothetical protein|nr:hypothetical protein [Pirellulales bacterium]